MEQDINIQAIIENTLKAQEYPHSDMQLDETMLFVDYNPQYYGAAAFAKAIGLPSSQQTHLAKLIYYHEPVIPADIQYIKNLFISKDMIKVIVDASEILHDTLTYEYTHRKTLQELLDMQIEDAYFRLLPLCLAGWDETVKYISHLSPVFQWLDVNLTNSDMQMIKKECNQRTVNTIKQCGGNISELLKLKFNNGSGFSQIVHNQAKMQTVIIPQIKNNGCGADSSLYNLFHK